MAELASKRTQVARIRRTAVRALADYPVDEPRLSFIAHGENTTFRVVRMRWDWETFFGNTMEYGGVPAAGCWELLPTAVRAQFDEVARRMGTVMAALPQGEFGLIHADLHLDNALFDGDTVRLIDFDDCGFGHWLYDLAVPLWDNRHRADYPAYRTALLEGYAERRDLPDLTHLDAFIATRDVAFGLWFAGMAQVNPSFATDLDKTVNYIHRSLEQALAT